MNYQKIITDIYQTILKGENIGKIPTYIPELGQVNPEKFGVYYFGLNNKSFGIGDFSDKFSIQSIAKVLAVSLAYSQLEDKLWERVGIEPSGTSFNSLVQLEADNGIPRNPLINSGALVVCDVLLSILKNPKEDFLNFVRHLANNNDIFYSKRIAESEKSMQRDRKSVV